LLKILVRTLHISLLNRLAMRFSTVNYNPYVQT